MADRCFICGEVNPNVLQRHHVVPRKYGGDDSAQNIVTLCANCHHAIEQLYDRRFYTRLKYALERDEKRSEGGDGDQVVDVEREGETGLYRCPVCARTANRRGKPFESRQSVLHHIWGSHDDAHANVRVRGEDGGRS